MNLSFITSLRQNPLNFDYHALIEYESDDKVVATVLGMSECKGYGDTEELALANLHENLSARLANAKIVPIRLKSSGKENPWMKLAGKYKDDPQFQAMLDYIEADRRQLDEETEAYYQQLDNRDEEK
jgi:predicted RNase H-like HicB family nuclease